MLFDIFKLELLWPLFASKLFIYIFELEEVWVDD